VISITSGVMTMLMVSLTKSAERTAVVTMALSSVARGLARRTALWATSGKNPARRRLATTIIIPNRSRIVS